MYHVSETRNTCFLPGYMYLGNSVCAWPSKDGHDCGTEHIVFGTKPPLRVRVGLALCLVVAIMLAGKEVCDDRLGHPIYTGIRFGGGFTTSFLVMYLLLCP